MSENEFLLSIIDLLTWMAGAFVFGMVFGLWLRGLIE